MKPFFDMSLLIAFGFLSLLLLLGVLLRAKIKFLQNFMVPACLTGGVIGFFILNTTGFPQVQPELYPALAYHFFTISFVCIGLRGMSKVDQSKGSATKEMVRGSIWQAQMFHMGLCSQLILATGIVYLLNALTGRDYLESIGFLAAQGFAAGPGQAISTGLVWEKFGHSGMGQLGMTFAGVGFIVAFAIGVPLVRWGVRKGLNTYPVGSVPEEVKTGLLAPENRPCGLRQVTQNSNVDSLALQLALVLGAWMLAYYAVEAVATRVPSSIGGTMWGLFFLINMVSGMLIRFVMRKLGIVHLIDGDSMTRLTGWMMEFLLLSTLIGIKFAVVKDYILPIIVLSVVLAVFTLFFILYFGRRVPGYSFERTVMMFGTCTGTIPTGLILLRMVAYAPILGIGGVMHVTQGNTGLAWIIVLDVAALLLLITVLMSIAMPKFKIMQTLVDKLNLVSREILTGVMPVRAFSRESFEEKRFDAASRELMGTQLFTNRAMVAMMPFMTLIMNGTSLLIVWFGGKAMDNGAMQVGEMIAFITYTMQIVMSFLMLAMVAVMLPRAGVAADRIDEVIRTKATIHDPDEADAKAAKEHKNWQGVVEFHDVSFRFPGADSDALEHISFTAKPGETTAIIGSTGCGKSTLLNLIPRFYDVTGGSVTVDGIDVRQMPQAQLHDLLGYVPQKGVLFSGTIDSNLKFGGDHITDAAVKKAAAIAQATEFIDAKPEGYASPIAQGGSNVSGGQKQRLSIARAIAKDPKIYLFDDSFSALDYKTDVALRRALKAQTDNATVIIVAQRISTVLHANQILVLDEGRLVGKGTHAQLMASCPEYQEIARSQLSQKELDLEPLNTEKEGV